MNANHDFDLHGIVGIRVVDAAPEDVAKVRRQVGPLDASLGRAPDISVRFVDRLETDVLTYGGVGDTGFDGDEFFVLRGRNGTRAKALFPFDAVGRELEIVCERAMPSVPHLLACINMAALARGVLPLHASAFELDGRGVLVMGWAKGGKTESLLAAMKRGASYVGDEWVYLTPDGLMMGVPEPIRLWDWHLMQLPEIFERRTGAERNRVTMWRTLASTAAAVGAGRPGSDLVRRVQPILQRQAYLQIPPEEMFGRDRMKLRSHLDAAVFVLSHDSEDIVVERAAPGEISGRMAASLLHERDMFMAHYRQFRFAFPSRQSDVVETATMREEALLRSLFDSRAATKVTHPYPCDLDVLGDLIDTAVRVEASRATPEVSTT